MTNAITYSNGTETHTLRGYMDHSGPAFAYMTTVEPDCYMDLSLKETERLIAKLTKRGFTVVEK